MLKFSWFHGMKIYSYFVHLKTQRKQRNEDIRQLLVSIQLRPRNWQYTRYSKGKGRKRDIIYTVDNLSEKMNVWIANGMWGLHFVVDGRYHGGVLPWFSRFTWRKKVYEIAKAATDNPWIKDHTFNL